MSKKQLSKEAVLDALKSSNATSLTALHKAMGGKGSVPGSTAKRVRELVPDIEAKLAANKVGKPKAAKPATGKPKPLARTTPYPRHSANPYREGSGYGLCFDILAAHPNGMSRQSLIDSYAKASGKDPLKGVRFDIAVVTSAKESATGPRHRSCREGYHVAVVNDHVRLVLPDKRDA